MPRDVLLVQVVGIAADREDVLALSRVVDVRQAGVVELQVAAADLIDALDFLGVRGGEVAPEDIQVGVDRLIDRRVAAAVVDHARRRDRQLRRLVGVGVVTDERERVREDRLAHVDPAADVHRRRRVVVGAVLVLELHVQRLALHLGDALQLVDEVHVPGLAAELAVGDRLQAG